MASVAGGEAAWRDCSLGVRCLDQRMKPKAAAKNNRLPHKRGFDARAKSIAARYVNQVLIRSPERKAAAKRWGSETKRIKASANQIAEHHHND
ncbi:MAG: hypothetical protein WKF71_06115 [Pyrinomonadaceae bacterium]